MGAFRRRGRVGADPVFHAASVAVVTKVHSFPPISDRRAERLILGSMPGRASLLANQYYAHPRNAFWPIMERLFGIPTGLPYELRCRALREQGIAVWDVLKACTRTSSLDSDIDQASIVVNDFETFFAAHPRLRAIYFNGATAEKMFEKHVLHTLPNTVAAVPRLRLPSTSPANASYSFARKLQQWRRTAG